MSDKSDLLGFSASELSSFAETEARLVRAASLSISDEQKKQLAALGVMLMQCARVGDIDRNLDIDRQIEQAIGLAAGLPDNARQHAADKAAFKKAWRSSHALRDAVPSVQMRIDQIACIVAGDGDGAARIGQAFFASVGKAL